MGNNKKTFQGVVTGEIVSIDDPTFHGRVKIRIPGINDNVEVEKLPWATYGGSSVFSGDGGGSISIPRVGTKVRVEFKKDDMNSMEWYATNRIDQALAEELAQDYEGAHALLYDSASDLSIMFTNSTGLRLYYKKSFVQISPDNNITIHYGDESSGVQIQLSDGKIDIQAPQQINITSDNTVNIEAQTVVVNGENNVQIKGDTPGEMAVNGKKLIQLLTALAGIIDLKIPGSHAASDLVTAAGGTLLNQQIQYI